MTRPAPPTHPALALPAQRALYYGGAWHPAADGQVFETWNPGTGASLGHVARAGAADVETAVRTARSAFPAWRALPPRERAALLRRVAEVLRANGDALALLDAANCGNPVTAMRKDIDIATGTLDYFAGLAMEAKGETVPMGPRLLNYTVRAPLGVVGRIVPFNHPLMFCAAKLAAPLAAGNTLVVKPPGQAPLSTLRFTELIEGVLPPGVFNVLPGGAEAGAALAAHPGVAKVALIGSVPTGRAVMRAAAETVKPVMLELGGKNALIAFPDAEPEAVAAGIVSGMNFAWCGQSCGSTSRVFLHADLHDAVLARVQARLAELHPGLPTDPATRMGAIISRRQLERIVGFIEGARAEGARLVCGGKAPDDPALAGGFYLEPTVFADVQPGMRLAREEVFGPVLAVLKWDDVETMLEAVNALELGLSCSIWTRDLATAHRAAQAVEAGYVWINQAGPHYLGAPFGGWKQSGFGREESLDELLAFTQTKNVNLLLD